MRLAGELAGRLDRPERLWGAPGLFTGMTGAAVLFLHLYDDTREGRYLCLAEAALHRDLDRCVAYPNGTLFVRDGARNLAYLDGGSAGIGIVLKQYLQRHEHRGFADSLRAIRRACSAPFVLQPGLFQGRAGMLAALRDGRPTTAPSPAVSAHIRRLGWHAVLYDGHLAFPGSRLRRLSMDLATGSAGVLLALGWTLSSEAVFLPFLDVQPNLDDEGGDNARDPQAAGAD